MATRPVVHNFITEVVRIINSSASVVHDTDMEVHPIGLTGESEDPVTFGIYGLGDHKDLVINAPVGCLPVTKESK